MNRLSFLLIIVVLLSFPSILFSEERVQIESQSAQNPSDPIVVPEDNQVKLVVHIRVYDEVGESLWDTKEDYLLIYGKPVQIKVKGASFRLFFNITAFEEKESVLLLMQAEVWSAFDSSYRYFSTTQTTSLHSDEKLILYPFGNQKNKEQKNQLVLEIYRKD